MNQFNSNSNSTGNVTPTTRQREHPHENKFLDWIRKPDELSSYKGYRLYDIDSFWMNVNTKCCVLLETKTNNQRWYSMKPHQRMTLEMLHRALSKGDEFTFNGVFLVTFEKELPSSGVHIARFDGTNWKELYNTLNEAEFISFLSMVVAKPLLK